jgi:hypothetical protein
MVAEMSAAEGRAMEAVASGMVEAGAAVAARAAVVGMRQLAAGSGR